MQSYFRNKNPCRNGPGCYFLSQNRCHFYHPLQHRRQRNNQTIYHDYRNQQNKQNYSKQNRNWSQSSEQFELYQQQESERQSEYLFSSEEQSNEEERISEADEMNSLNSRIQYQQFQFQNNSMAQNELLQFQNNLMIEQYFDNIQFLLPYSKNKDFEWFFSRNSHLKIVQIPIETLEKFNQCSICIEQFVKSNCKKSEQNLIAVKYQNIKQQINENKKENENQIKLTQLYCKHIFHQECIKQWLNKYQTKCPLCKNDFRDHQAYKKWDQNYDFNFKHLRTFAEIQDISVLSNIFGIQEENQLENNISYGQTYLTGYGLYQLYR